MKSITIAINFVFKNVHKKKFYTIFWVIDLKVCSHAMSQKLEMFYFNLTATDF